MLAQQRLDPWPRRAGIHRKYQPVRERRENPPMNGGKLNGRSRVELRYRLGLESRNLGVSPTCAAVLLMARALVPRVAVVVMARRAHRRVVLIPVAMAGGGHLAFISGACTTALNHRLDTAAAQRHRSGQYAHYEPPEWAVGSHGVGQGRQSRPNRYAHTVCRGSPLGQRWHAGCGPFLRRDNELGPRETGVLPHVAHGVVAALEVAVLPKEQHAPSAA